MTKGAFLVSVAPHTDIKPHDIASSYWSFYHDLSGHFKSTIKKTQGYLEAIYVKKGLQKIDQKNGNYKEAQKLLKFYIDVRQDFLSKLLSSAEKNLSFSEQLVFHETIFNYLHEGQGGAIEPQRMHKFFSESKEKNNISAFIEKELSKYISTHDLELLK